ncbi:MAG TPA: transposase [Kofleriaceae bacterium]|nr:transposase [Kofleriaceae bacterium]
MVAHRRRERFGACLPQHVTLRVVDGVGSLRRHRSMRIVRQAILAGGHRLHFRVIEFSVQSNHLHLIVEADGADGLARGMIGLAVRLARRLNRLFGRRGRFFAERYHSRSLRTPTEVRHAVRYVLLNHRHHARREEPPRGAARAAAVDECSSGIWFDGWSTRLDPREVWQRELLSQPRPTAFATVWLLTTGWKRRGLLDRDESPGAAPTISGQGRKQGPTP